MLDFLDFFGVFTYLMLCSIANDMTSLLVGDVHLLWAFVIIDIQA
jgi:hypothetical protein